MERQPNWIHDIHQASTSIPWILYILQLPRQLDIKSRIAAATKAFGALTKFWYNQHVWHLHQIFHLPSHSNELTPVGMLSMVLTEIATDETWSLPHLKCPKNTPHISSQEGKNNKWSSQKTMCREYDRRKLLIWCLLKPTEEIPPRPTKDGGLEPKSQTSAQTCTMPEPEQRRQRSQQSSRRTRQNTKHKTSRPTQTRHHRLDCHLSANSKHRHNLLRPR